MNIVNFVGFMGSGKDTSAKILIEEFGFNIINFSDSLKDSLSAIFLWDRDLLEGETPESREWREQVDLWWATRLGIPEFTPRWALQNYATEIMRNHFHPEVWILNVEKKISNLPKNSKVVLIGRYRNEIALARRLGGRVIRVKSGNEPEWYETALEANRGCAASKKAMTDVYKIHSSEWDWIGYDFDHVIENDRSRGMDYLYNEVVEKCQLR